MHLRHKGFSLLEMLLVVSILGIIAVIAVPRYAETVAQRDLDIAAQQMVTDLRWSIQMAANSTDTTIVKINFINASPYGYTIVQGAAETVIKPTYRFPTTIFFPNTQNAVSFNVYGRPADGNDVTITLRNTRTQSKVVIMDHLTGLVKIQ